MSNTISCVIPQPDVLEIPDSIQGDRRLISEMAPVIRNPDPLLSTSADPQPLSDLRPHLTPIAATETALAEIPDTIEDRQAVAARIKNLRAQTNLNEKRVAIGREYKAHRDRLRRNSRHDRDRDGWHAEFTKPSPFEDSRRGAEIHIQFCEAFGHLGSMLPRLPHGFRALQVLVTLKLSDAEIKSKCLSGEISPTSTEGQIWKVGAALGGIQPKVAIKKSKVPLLSREAWDRLSQGKRKKLARDIGLKDLLDAYSPTVAELLDAAGTKRCNELWKRAKGQLIELGAPETKVLLLPAPAKSSPPSNDLVPAWDAATPDERKKLRHEREAELYEAI
jgi:hypothetical protein